MKLTKQQRREIYKKALKMLHNEISNGTQCTAVCPNLFDVSQQMGIEEGFLSISVDFPEFYSQKPADRKLIDVWWDYDKNGNLQREEALLKAIELTKD